MDQQKIKNSYDHIIIGGGIVGAGICRDLALHGEDILLLEKGDYGSQTSQGSSKMLHGGIRYLENFDFALVFEALKEKKIWLKLAPHLSYEKKFFLPVYKESKWPLFFLRIGLFLYDLLSLFKNPPYRIINAKSTQKGLPGLNSKGLRGAGVYSDGIIDDSKLVLDLIFDAKSRGAQTFNYHEVISVHKENNLFIVHIKNLILNKVTFVQCKNLIIAAGPFTDQLMHKLELPWKDILLPSKGSHIWLKKDALEIKDAMVLQTKDKRIIFVIPQRNAILVGTTEIPLESNTEIFNIKPSNEEIEYLIENINYYFPDSKITDEQILSSFCAVRPLVKAGESSSKTSRNHKIYTPMEGLFVIAGGKYTTFRIMAKDLCKKLFKANHKKYQVNLSLTPLKHKSLVFDIHNQELTEELIHQIIQTEEVKTQEDLIKRRLSLYSLSQYKQREKLDYILKKIKID